MKFVELNISGLYLIEPTVYKDERGYFYETFRADLFREKTGFLGDFIQDNESFSYKNVLRGLHFQNPPFAQAKLVRVVQGEVLDVAVDLRKDSPTYGKHEIVRLSAENKRIFFIPEGFAHGFLTVSDTAVFSYKCSQLYAPNHEGGLLWNDPDLDIDWTTNNPIISSKDADLMNFDKFASNF
jgi:dTDP-4-dehydrorhamnose 3,5-epimerase